MSTKSMSYDHPTYTAVDHADGYVSGANANQKFTAFTGMIVKSVSVRPDPAASSTSNDVVSFYTLVGTNTTTFAVGTYGSGVSTFTNVAVTSSNTLAQGDMYWLGKGTDASVKYSFSVENLVTPGATVTQ